jgi:hypothetical protein
VPGTALAPLRSRVRRCSGTSPQRGLTLLLAPLRSRVWRCSGTALAPLRSRVRPCYTVSEPTCCAGIVTTPPPLLRT